MLVTIACIINIVLVIIQYYWWWKYTQPSIFLYTKRPTDSNVGFFQITVKNIGTIPARLLAITTRGVDYAPQILHDTGIITNEKLKLINGLSRRDTIRQMKAVTQNQYIIQPGEELHLFRVTDEKDADIIRQYLLDTTPHIIIHYQAAPSILNHDPYMWSASFDPNSWRTFVTQGLGGQNYAKTILVEQTR